MDKINDVCRDLDVILEVNDNSSERPEQVASVDSVVLAPTTTSVQAAPGVAYRTLTDLPNQLLDQVFAYIEKNGEHPRPITADDYPTNAEHHHLKALRLVSKAFNVIASQYLFETIVLYQHAGRWEALNQIAQTPNLAPLVKHLKVAHISWLEQFKTYEAWAAATAHGRGYRGFMTEHPPAGGPLANLDYQSAEWGYKRYVAWRSGESAMRRHAEAGTAPNVSLQLLVNLESIETIGIRGLSVVKRKPWRRWHGLWLVSDASRRHFETGLLAGHKVHGWHIHDNQPIVMTHLLSMIIVLKRSGKELTRLRLRCIDELMRSEDVDEDNVALDLPSLQHLQIDTSQHWQYQCRSRDLPVASWVKSLKNLKILSIKQHPSSEDEGDLFALLGKTWFQSLEEVSATHARTTFIVLANFVAQHFQTLKTMRIMEPVMAREQWALFRSGFVDYETPAPHDKKVVLSKETWEEAGTR